ncbi:hypothetical protein [Mesorhizobium sangaii]|uniref:Uncharacterized protein n=1 Tax=Mesorhizobium sangaii TaxID=505389 RepID=A0A841PGP0_9HYPH|nr:hypothetical protein [Mesorhizobium sangaii]MBB6409139.1 hypothetical protein [Mesorhizobium sangaii]
MAFEYLAYEAGNRDSGGPMLLPWIVQDMPRDLSPVEVAFLTIVALSAGDERHDGNRGQTARNRRLNPPPWRIYGPLPHGGGPAPLALITNLAIAYINRKPSLQESPRC